MKQAFFDGIVQPIDHHYGNGFAAGDTQRENRVVAGGAMQDLIDFFRAYSYRDRISSRTVEDGRGSTRHAQPPRFILAARGPRFRNNRDIFSHLINPYLTINWSLRALNYTNNVLTEPSSWID